MAITDGITQQNVQRNPPGTLPRHDPVNGYLLTGVLNSFGAITWREMADRKSAVLQVSRAMPPDDEASWPAVIEWFQAATNATFKHLKPTQMPLRTDVGLPTDLIEDDDDVLDAERQAAT